MEEQSYAKHTKFVPLFHGALSAFILMALGGSVFGLFRSAVHGTERLVFAVLVFLALAVALLFWFCRIFPLKAQDRAIRAEENLRHFALTGSLLDKRLSMKQIIGLRFASDEEFAALAQKAASESMPPDAIKRAVKTWRPDHCRL